MNNTKKILIAGAFATLISATLPTQADGFLSKMFGSKGGASFETMLTHVPADTAYMFTNKEPIPNDVMEFHLKRSQEAFSMIAKMKESEKAKKSDDEKDAEKIEEKHTAQAFFKALTDDLGSKLTEGKIEDSGLSLKATSLIYGYKQMPVMRISFADKEKIMATLKRAEEKSGYKMELEKCGDFECFKGKGKKDAPSMTMVLLKDHLAASLFSEKNKADVLDHLIGKSDPKEAYSEKQWDTFLKDNGYKGFGDGFVNLKKLYEVNKTAISDGLFAMKKGSMADITEEDKKACTAVVDDHIDNMPEIIFGTKNLEEKNMDYEMVFKTSSGVSDVLLGLANKTNIAQRSGDPIVDLGINLDFKQTSAAITTYSNFLIKSAEDNKCKLIKPKDIRKSMGGLMMVMNMGLAQFKSLYFSLDNLELSERMQPKKLDAMLSIGTDDPAGLLAMVGMMSPALAGFKVPEDGTPVKLPAGAIPSKGMPVPPLSISRGAKSLNIMVGNDKPELKDYKSETPEMMVIAVDGKRYYEIIGNVMKVLPKPKGMKADDSDDEALNLMTTMGNMMGKIKEEIFADKRGLVINYHVQYK